MMDSEGAWHSYPEPGPYRMQPAFDMDVLNIIRHKWIELRNRKMEEDMRNNRR